MPQHQRMPLRGAATAVALLALVLPALATCPVTLPSSAFSGAVTPCASPPSLTALCTQCLPAVAGPFVMAGVSASDAVTLGVCIQSNAVAVLTAGVNSSSLASLAACSTPSPPPPPPSAASPPPPAPSCPVAQTLSFASAVAPCANASTACTACATALATPFVLNGVSPSDAATLGLCINAQIGAIMTAGVSPTTLFALTACGSAQPPPPLASASPPASSPPPQATPATCPISTTLSFAAAVTPCSVPSNLCTSCLTALATPFVLAGVPPSSTAVIAACMTTQFTAMVAAGVSPTTVMGLSSCGAAPAPPSAALPPPQAAAATTPVPPPAAQPGGLSVPNSASPPPVVPAVPTLACTVAQPIDFTGAVQPCSNASNACGPCLQALAASVIRAGVQFNNTAAWVSCFQTHSLEMLAVGVPMGTLTAMNWCTARSYLLAAPPTPSSMPPSPPPAWSQLNMFDLSSGAQGVGPWRVGAAAVVALLLV